MPPPLFRSLGARSTSSGPISPGAPTGLTLNDIDVCHVVTLNETATADQGFLLVYESPGFGTPAGVGANRLLVFARIWDGVAGDPLITAANGSSSIRAAYSGGNPTGTPWAVLGSNEQAATTAISITGGTPAWADALILAISSAAGPAANTTTEVSGWTNPNLDATPQERYDEWLTPTGLGMAFADASLAIAALTGPTTATSVTSTPKENVTIALQPPPAPGAIPIVGWEAVSEFAQSVPGTINLDIDVPATEASPEWNDPTLVDVPVVIPITGFESTAEFNPAGLDRIIPIVGWQSDTQWNDPRGNFQIGGGSVFIRRVIKRKHGQ